MTSSARLVLANSIASLSGQSRPAQEKLCDLVDRGLGQVATTLLQAGTGTGKSLGYLSAALVHCADRRVVISTATLALQRQLLTKDLPVVLNALSNLGLDKPRVALLKGWSNYACRWKLAAPEEADLLAEIGLDLDPSVTGSAGQTATRQGRETVREIRRVRQWVKDSETGDRDDLQPGVSEKIWSQVSIRPQECSAEACFFYSQCFAHLAKEKAFKADVIVTNHSILGIAATASAELLPEYQALIVDEAHELVDRVRSQATLRFSAKQLSKIVKSAGKKLNQPVSNLVDLVKSLAKQLKKI